MSNNSKESQRSIVLVDALLLLIVFLFFAVIFILTLSMGPTAGKVPRLVVGIGMLLCVTQLIRSYTSKAKESQEEEALNGIPWYKMLVCIIAYLVALEVFGFSISTLAFLAGVPRLMQYKNWRIIGIFSVLATVMLYYSFTTFFKVRLPEGIFLNIFYGVAR